MDRRAMDEAKASRLDSRVDRDRDQGDLDRQGLQMLCTTRHKIKMYNKEVIAVGGKLVTRPALRQRMLWYASLYHNRLVDLDRGGGDMGTRGSPGQQP